MNHVVLTFSTLYLDEIHDLVVDDSCGAISYFIGTTRDNFESKKVLSLEYEAYEPMAIKELEKICHNLRSRWADIINIAIYHRLGLVKVREASVIIAISSPHRQSALDATAEAIEQLKCRVPIWKKEKYEDDEIIWKENKECTWLSRTSNRHFENIETVCQTADDTEELKPFVQISAPESEIERRMECFLKKKRDQINVNNSMDFMGIEYNTKTGHNNEVTCARTGSMVIKHENSKGHLKVRRARNITGPQTRPEYLQALNKHMLKVQHASSAPQIDEKNSLNAGDHMNLYESQRLANIEEFLRVSTCKSRSIQERIKEIENRILCLEAISPEYKHFLDTGNDFSLGTVKSTCIKKNTGILTPKRKTYTIKQLDDMIKCYEQNFAHTENQS